MIAKEVASQVRQLPPEELRRFAEWWEDRRNSLLSSCPPDSSEELWELSEAQEQELVRRREETRQDPGLLEPFEEEDLDRMIRQAADARTQEAPARPR